MASFAFALSCVLSSASLAADSNSLPALNDIQVLGTHNSYHIQSKFAFHPSHKYTHLSLSDQLEKRGMRAFELDVHQSVLSPDLSVYHIGLIDGKTSCAKFKDCLRELRAWSDLHPDHVPIFVWIEIKDDTGGTQFSNFDQVDLEIQDVLGDRLIIPDHVRKGHESLQEAVQSEGWPTLSESRGRFMFMLDQDERTSYRYLHGKSLEGRVMFPRASEATMDEPWAVVAKTAPGPFHDEVMARNFLVSDNVCSAGDLPNDCFARLEKARSAGTHLLMDDFEGGADAQKNAEYFVRFPDGLNINCNPVTSRGACFDFEWEAQP